MTKRRFICKNCGHSFVKEVLDPGEAEEKRIRPVPIRCPKCGSSNVERD